MKLSEFDYYLPRELIAQRPIEKRDNCRLMVVDRKNNSISHKRFGKLRNYLNAGDCVMFNDAKVIPARFIGRKSTGGKIDVLLTEQKTKLEYLCLVSSNRPIKRKTQVFFKNGICASLKSQKGKFKVIEFSKNLDLKDLFSLCGVMPLPPYIKRSPDKKDNIDYQTVYANKPGAIASPTAGLHFTKEFLRQIQTQSVSLAYLTLHVGLGTFEPVKKEDIKKHKMHKERFSISRKAAKLANEAKLKGKVLAVGTTALRTLESCAVSNGKNIYEIKSREGQTDLFIYPGYKFKFVDSLLTNFHLPKTTLLMLVSAFCGRELLFKAYREAVEEEYRFYSYGDAMLII